MSRETEVIEMLNLLAEFNSQKDILSLQKRDLLEEVKIPLEVEKVVRDGMQEISRVESTLRQSARKFDEQIDSQLAQIVIPEEIKKALAEIDRQREEIFAQKKQNDEKINREILAKRTEMQAEIESKTREVYAQVALRKGEIEAEFSGKEEDVTANISKLEGQIKEAVKEVGFTVHGDFFMAVYVKGKKSWKADRLEKYTEDHPDIKGCYSVGDPSITIRKA